MFWSNFKSQCIRKWWVWSIYIELWVRFWFKKLVISFRVIKKIEIIFLCSQIKVLLKENYFENKLIASSWVIKIESSSRLVKTQFKSEFLTQVFKLSQNSWLKYLSWVRRFNSSNQVKLENWNWVLTWNSRLDSSRHEARYY